MKRVARGKDADKRIEAVKLNALGIIERVVGPGDVKLMSRWAKCVERIGFEFDTVFCEDGAAGERERAINANLIDQDLGDTTDVF